MQLLILILKNVKLQEEIMKQLVISGVKGGTILEGTGMAAELANMQDLPLLGILRQIMSYGENSVSKVMLFVLKEEQLKITREVIKKVTGDLNVPNTGIMFSIPVDNVEGFGE